MAFLSRSLSQSLLLEMGKSLPTGVFLADIHDKIVFVNPEFFRLWRLEQADFETRDIAAITRELADQLVQPCQFALWSPEKPTMRSELRLKTGFVLEQSSTRLFDSEGAALGWMASFRDISESTRIREGLTASNERFDFALAGTDEGIWDWNLETDEVYYSPAWFRLLGYQPDALPGRLESWTRNIHPLDLRGLRRAVKEHLDSGSDVCLHRHRLKTGDGSWVWVEAKGKVLCGEDDRPLRMIGTLVNIDRQKQAEQALQESETRFRTLLEGSIQGICIHSDFRPLFVNEAFARIYGYESIAQAMATDMHALLPEEERETAERLWRKSLQDPRHTAVFQAKNVTRQGNVIWVEVMLRAIEWKGQPAQQLTIIDISERKRFEVELLESKSVLEHQALELASLAEDLETARQEAERHGRSAEAANHAKSQFLATMSHELRTPLNAILGFSEIISQQAFGPSSVPQYAEYAKDINNSGQHLLALINDILDIAKIEAGKLEIRPERLGVRDVLESCFRLNRVRADERRVELNLEVAADAGYIHADERAIKQIVFNLLSNAIKFTPPGGRVTLSADSLEDGTTMLSVADTGIGIPEHYLDRVLKPFEQVNNSYNRDVGGTGLGLTLVKSLTNLHGGDMTINSREGQGTVITLHFPTPRDASLVAVG